MLQIGKFNLLNIVKEVPFGLYLESERGEILLPSKYVPAGAKPGDTINVFIYKDSEDRIIATTLVPKAQAGEFACLKVKQINNAGAFMDWGLEKDLMVPYREQHRPMQEGKSYIVQVVLDPQTERLIGVGKLAPFLSKDISALNEGMEVELLITEYTDLGITAIIDNKYRGMLFKNEVFQNLEIGAKIKGYIKTIRDDGKIDLSLRKPGFEEVKDSTAVILEKLKLVNKLNYSDNSSPEEIKEEFGMSKKTFKKAIGVLYKQGRIVIEENSIRLNSDD